MTSRHAPRESLAVALRLEDLLPQAMRRLFQFDEDPFRQLTIGQVRLLQELSNGPRSASELGQELGLSPSSVTQMTARLMAAGLVVKDCPREDRRLRRISLTTEGATLLEMRRAMRARSAAEVLSQITPERREELVELVEEIVRHSRRTGAAEVRL